MAVLPLEMACGILIRKKKVVLNDLYFINGKCCHLPSDNVFTFFDMGFSWPLLEFSPFLTAILNEKSLTPSGIRTHPAQRECHCCTTCATTTSMGLHLMEPYFNYWNWFDCHSKLITIETIERRIHDIWSPSSTFIFEEWRKVLLHLTQGRGFESRFPEMEALTENFNRIIFLNSLYLQREPPAASDK